MLQNLCNHKTLTKEPYMVVLDPFVDVNKGRISQFFNELCEVGDFYETLEVGAD